MQCRTSECTSRACWGVLPYCGRSEGVLHVFYLQLYEEAPFYNVHLYTCSAKITSL